MLAPARLVLALLAVLAAVGGVIFHLVDVDVATRVVLLTLIFHCSSGDNFISAEVVDVAVFRAKLGLHFLNLFLDGGLGLASLFLHG